MILYGAPMPAPNPRRVRIFLAEKGINLPETTVDMRKREHKSTDYRAKNSLGQIPTLELDDGATISETVAICRYFEETNPEPPLFGRTALEKAHVDMWVRRVEFVLMTPVGNFWRHAHPYTAALLTQFKDFGESNREAYASALKWLDRDLPRLHRRPRLYDRRHLRPVDGGFRHLDRAGDEPRARQPGRLASAGHRPPQRPGLRVHGSDEAV